MTTKKGTRKKGARVKPGDKIEASAYHLKEKSEKMTWEQIDRLARGIAVELMDAEVGSARTLLLLMNEIGAHPFDQGHVETIAILMRTHLFAVMTESDRAEELLVAELREKLQKGGGAGR